MGLTGMPWPCQPKTKHEGAVAAVTCLPDTLQRAPHRLPHVPPDIDDVPLSGSDEDESSSEDDGDGVGGIADVAQRARAAQARAAAKAAAEARRAQQEADKRKRRGWEPLPPQRRRESVVGGPGDEVGPALSGPHAHTCARIVTVCSSGLAIAWAASDLRELARDHVGMSGAH